MPAISRGVLAILDCLRAIKKLVFHADVKSAMSGALLQHIAPKKVEALKQYIMAIRPKLCELAKWVGGVRQKSDPLRSFYGVARLHFFLASAARGWRLRVGVKGYYLPSQTNGNWSVGMSFNNV